MFTAQDLKGFAEAAHSLKLYRRADLREDITDKSLIGKLYVDPLQHNAALETMLRESTTFLIGRKGTGKSTIFQRAQYELRTKPNVISAYVDIKTVFEAADVDPALPAHLAEAGLALSEDGLRRVLLYRSFIRAVFNDIKKELKDQVNSGLFVGMLAKLGFKKSDITSQIDELLEGSFESQITDITALSTVSAKISKERSGSRTDIAQAKFGGEMKATGPALSALASAKTEKTSGLKNVSSEEYSQVILRTFNINIGTTE